MKRVLLIVAISLFALMGVCTVLFIGIGVATLSDPEAVSDGETETLVRQETVETPEPSPTPTPGPSPTPESTPVPTRTPAPTPTPEPITSVEQLIDRYENSIGVITADNWLLGGGVATGFIVGVEGDTAFVITNHHVVDGATDMKIELSGISYDLTLLGSHEYEDVAALSICCGTFRSIPHSTMPVTPGTEVVAVGFPARTEQAIHSQGRILRLTQHYGSSSPVLEHTAELHPGSSGSPLFTIDGYVIGINRGANVQDATRFVATSYMSVRSLIDRWTGQVVSEVETIEPQPSMWVIVTDDEVYVDTEFDFTDEYGMDVFIDGDEYCNPQRIYADEGRHALGCESPEDSHLNVERASVQTRGGQDLRCIRDDELSSDMESVFACTWR